LPDPTKKSAGQTAAEAEVDRFRNDLGPFVVAAETTRMAMVFTDALEPGNPIIFANDAFLALTGYERLEVLGKGFNFLLAHAADAEGQAAIDAEFSGKSERGLTHELGAEVLLDYRPEGVVCSIDIPVPDGGSPDGCSIG
jgi:PAS domain-containing protein